MTSASRFLPALGYVKHGHATPTSSTESLLYATSNLSDHATPTSSMESLLYATSELDDIISAKRDTFARRVDFGPSRLQSTNKTQAQDEIERSEFKLPNMGSLSIIIGVNALSQVISVYATLSQRPITKLFPFSFLSSSSFHLQVSTQHTLEAQPLFPVSIIGVPVVFSGIALIFTTRYDGGDHLPFFYLPLSSQPSPFTGRYKGPLYMSYASMVLGNVLYALAYRANFLYLILIGRTVTGFGLISFMYAKRYCSDPRIVGIRRRTTLASWLASGQGFGACSGPFIGGLLYKVGFANRVFNGMSSPGWILSVIWILFGILSSQIFKDVPIQPRGESGDLYELSQTNREKESQLSTVEKRNVTPPSQQWGVIICMCYYSMTCYFMLGSWEANIPIFTAQVLNYSPYQVGNFLALGGIAAFPFLMLNVRYARHIEDRFILAVGTRAGHRSRT